MRLSRTLRVGFYLTIGALAVLANACSQSDRKYGSPSARVIAPGEPVPKGGGTYKVGEPYKIEGEWFTPREQPDYDQTGHASYYAEDFHGRRTSNGEVF